METKITVTYGVQAKSPAPLFRVIGGAAVSSSRPVTGLECSGFGGSVSPVEYVSGAMVTGAAHVQLVRVEQRELLLARIGGGDDGTFSFNGSDSDSDAGNTGGTSTSNTDGAKPMTPWGYRTSSPPG